jgi:hypothetical protein
MQEVRVEESVNIEESVFLLNDWKEGVIMTYPIKDIKKSMCRGCMKITVLIFLLGLFYIAWGLCDICVLALTVGSCAASCLGASWLTVSCLGGVGATLLRGIRIGSQLASVDLHLKI